MRRAWWLLLLASGCSVFESAKYKTYPWNPYPDVENVAILLFTRAAEPPIDAIEFGNIFASEMLKFGGFRVVRPQALRLALQEEGQSGTATSEADLVLRAARRLKADAAVLAEITDYDPYEPPRIAISVTLLRAAGRSLSDAQIDRMVRSPSWRRGPVALTREQAGHWMGSFERVYDAHQESVRDEIIAYSQAQDETDTPFERGREFLAVQSRFIQFVSNQIINEIVAMGLPLDEWR